MVDFCEIADFADAFNVVPCSVVTESNIDALVDILNKYDNDKCSVEDTHRLVQEIIEKLKSCNNEKEKPE